MDKRVLIWHWHDCDLAVSLLQLSEWYSHPVTVYGLCNTAFRLSEGVKNKSFMGVPRISAVRAAFYDECLVHLKKQYEEKGLVLRISDNPVDREILLLCEELDIDEVWFRPQHGIEAQDFFKGLYTSVHSEKPEIQFHRLRTNTLLAKEELPFPVEAVPESFSSFRRSVERRPWNDYSFSTFPHEIDSRHSPGRRRMKHFIFEERSILHYKETRNGLGPGDYCSRLSKWLAAGAISAAEVGAAILHFEETVMRNESTYWLLFELLWRDYFYHLSLKIGKRLYTPRGMRERRSSGLRDSIPWIFPGTLSVMRYHERHLPKLEELWLLFRLWALGRTGMSLIDACIRHLRLTGYLNFRGRAMIVSFAIHVLRLPWRLIIYPMAQMMADYVPGIHISQLQMQAGLTGINALRVYNPTKQLKDHDSECVFVKSWVPELAEYEPALIHTLPQQELAPYPRAAVDHRQESSLFRKEYYSIKKSDQARAASREVLEQHGSRKRRS